MKLPVIICFFLLGPAAAHADTVYMLDGTAREGIIESHDARELRLRVDRDGISGTMVIPMTDIRRAVIERHPVLPIAATPPPPATGPTDADAPPDIPAPTEQELDAYRARPFLLELVASAIGQGTDDMARLPLGMRQLWERAAKADTTGHLLTALQMLRALDTAMQDLPDGAQRIDAVTRRERDEGFGVWMAQTHWATIAGTYATGQFDLSDVRDVERPALIGLLKQQTGPALDPLRPYFPPTDDATGQPGPFHPAQLQGITLSNAVDIKDKATLAAAVILAQLKLEPAMPAVDKGLLYNELTVVNRIKSRATELEPLAKAAADRAARDQRANDEKARRDAAIQAHKAVQNPK